MKLTIGIITMNRAEQLKEALKSCLLCALPKETEFVIIDNASTDNTQTVVEQLLSVSPYPFFYKKLDENRGVGGGRNLCFQYINGEYVYMMDDDAFIDSTMEDKFFIKACDILDNHKDIAVLTTQIYDRIWKANRLKESGGRICDGVYHCKMFCGGSHFLRREYFKQPPYLSNKYGYEELPPSLLVQDDGKINAFCPELLVIHNPKIDKWDKDSLQNLKYLLIECATPYAIKKTMYPKIFAPILWLAYMRRKQKYLSKFAGAKTKCNKMVKDIIKENTFPKRIKIKTVFWLYKEFGVSIF